MSDNWLKLLSDLNINEKSYQCFHQLISTLHFDLSTRNSFICYNKIFLDCFKMLNAIQYLSLKKIKRNFLTIKDTDLINLSLKCLFVIVR